MWSKYINRLHGVTSDLRHVLFFFPRSLFKDRIIQKPTSESREKWSEASPSTPYVCLCYCDWSAGSPLWRAAQKGPINQGVRTQTEHRRAVSYLLVKDGLAHGVVPLRRPRPVGQTFSVNIICTESRRTTNRTLFTRDDLFQFHSCWNTKRADDVWSVCVCYQNTVCQNPVLMKWAESDHWMNIFSWLPFKSHPDSRWSPQPNDLRKH